MTEQQILEDKLPLMFNELKEQLKMYFSDVIDCDIAIDKYENNKKIDGIIMLRVCGKLKDRTLFPVTIKSE